MLTHSYVHSVTHTNMVTYSFRHIDTLAYNHLRTPHVKMFTHGHYSLTFTHTWPCFQIHSHRLINAQKHILTFTYTNLLMLITELTHSLTQICS